MSVSDEAGKLARVAADQLPGVEMTFQIRPDLYGQGAEVISGAENILRQNGKSAVQLTVESEDCIRIQA